MENEIKDLEGKVVGKLELASEITDANVSSEVIHKVVRWQRAKARQGTHSTLNRAKMTGGGKKPFKQKGTGNARAGTRNSPLWRGGAVIFGPTPRDYSFKLQKKVRKNAMLSTLKMKFSENVTTVVDSFNIETPKTKVVVESLKKLGLEKGDKVVCVYGQGEESAVNFKRAAKNIKNCELISVDGLNVYNLLNAKNVVVSKTALDELSHRYSK